MTMTTTKKMKKKKKKKKKTKKNKNKNKNKKNDINNNNYFIKEETDLYMSNLHDTLYNNNNNTHYWTYTTVKVLVTRTCKTAIRI